MGQRKPSQHDNDKPHDNIQNRHSQIGLDKNQANRKRKVENRHDGVAKIVHLILAQGEELPKAYGQKCTAEACSFRDAYAELRNLDAEVIGVSADSPESHLAFAKRYDLPFTLLSDEKNKARKLLGVPGSMFGLLPGRVTYVIDENGVVKHVFDSQLQAKQHVREAMEHLQG